MGSEKQQKKITILHSVFFIAEVLIQLEILILQNLTENRGTHCKNCKDRNFDFTKAVLCSLWKLNRKA